MNMMNITAETMKYKIEKQKRKLTVRSFFFKKINKIGKILNSLINLKNEREKQVRNRREYHHRSNRHLRDSKVMMVCGVT